MVLSKKARFPWLVTTRHSTTVPISKLIMSHPGCWAVFLPPLFPPRFSMVESSKETATAAQRQQQQPPPTTDALRSFHLRVLFPQILSLPKNDPKRINAPPRITRSAAIDSELYTYIALLVRDFIHPWYRVVTNDQDFCAEIVRIFTLIIRQLEDRFCNQVDWTELILISAANLVTIHYHDYRQAKIRLHMSHAGSTVSLETLFHGSQPHFALQRERSPQQQTEYLRALTDEILKVLLDPADYNSDCVRHVVRELLANLVLANIIEGLADPYIIHLIICKLLDSYTPLVEELEASNQFTTTPPQPPQPQPEPSAKPDKQPLKKQLEEAQATELTESSPVASVTSPKKESLPSHMQRLQEKRRQEGDELMDAGREELDAARKHERQRFSFIYITLQVILSPIRALWLYIMAALTHSQERYQQVAKHTKRTRHVRLLEPWMYFVRVAFLVDDRPVLQWMWYMAGMFLWPLVRVLGGGLLVDKFLEQAILYILSEDNLVYYLQLGRYLLWPNGTFLRKGEPVSDEEKEQLRIRAERLLTVSFPGNRRDSLS
ncbi:PXA domain-containing protein [Zychaea mexicana]|uniref:PXA domain-containing protein n=1 Tax=Zychaea mexicana TaxID=64656 RepID=UPI0022FF225A|nr:PXA domain-containing protein [Zychaea mexicana]KAI9497815.1 PXA domain-containing protein [Zychaea mexicana]